jgi:hypothetical protein
MSKWGTRVALAFSNFVPVLPLRRRISISSLISVNSDDVYSSHCTGPGNPLYRCIWMGRHRQSSSRANRHRWLWIHRQSRPPPNHRDSRTRPHARRQRPMDPAPTDTDPDPGIRLRESRRTIVHMLPHDRAHRIFDLLKGHQRA